MSEIRTTGQVARLIAFFHVPGNPSQIASPPVNSVTISLEGTTAWHGFATNAGWTEDPQNSDPRDSAPDYVLTPVGGGPESSSRVVDFVGNIAVVELRVRDYGGRTQVRADAAGQSPTLPLPRDAGSTGSNWIPDGGWWTGPETVGDNFAFNDVWNADADTASPAASGVPGNGLQGDGLKVFEEYRGFVVGGMHRRTHPSKKDLFVSSLVTRQDLSGEQSIDFARNSLEAHGARLHFLDDHTEVTAFSEREYRLNTSCDPPSSPDTTSPCVRWLNFNSGSGPGLAPPSGWLRPQGALRLIVIALPGDEVGRTRGQCIEGGHVPATANQAWWIFVDVNKLAQLGQQQSASGAQVNNEVRRTAGHEIGHGLHVKHRGDPDQCQDSATVGSGPSMMNSGWGGGVGSNDPRSRYNDDDVRQMRWHLNTN